MDTFAEALRKARSGAGWSQQTLADAIHVSRTMIGHYESDTHPVIPPRKRVLAIAKALDLTALATDRLLTAAGYGSEYPVDPGELAGLVHLEEARIKHLVVDHLEVPHVPPFGHLARRADFYAHISLPPNYITRAEVLADVRAALFGKAPALALTSAVKSKPTALHGMGGIGKSVIARALCDDPQVQAGFPDGILWTTLGQIPDLIARLSEWITALGGTISEYGPTVDSLKANLANLLKDRACLLILDDVWQRKHAETFLVGGPRCRLLISTRDAELARGLGARAQPIPLMTRVEAVRLLEEWANGQLAEVEHALKERIVERVGRLPLAVKLAGAQLQRRPPDNWLRTFDARRLKPHSLEDIHDSLEATFGLSLDALDADTRRLYIALAIFKEDEAIRIAGIVKLWHSLGGLAPDATADLLDHLAGRALLEYRVMESKGGRWKTENRSTAQAISHSPSPIPNSPALSVDSVVILHDLLRDCIDTELGDEGVAAHRTLLNAYRATCAGTGWHTAPDDGYLYDHLAYHLDAVGAADELKTLFADQGWMNVRVPQSGYLYSSYLADLDLAWKHANAQAWHQIDTGQEPTALANCVRYVLIRTSITSVAANHIPELVTRAVETGLWTVERALSVAATIPVAGQKARMYAALLGTGKLSQSQQVEAQWLGLDAALAIEWDQECEAALAKLAPHLTGTALKRGLDAAMTFKYEGDCAHILTALAPQLTGVLLQQSLHVALVLESAIARAQALTALISHLSGDQRMLAIQRSLDAALAIEGKGERARALTAIVPHLSGEQRTLAIQRGLDAALAIEGKGERAQVLTAIVPYLSGQQQYEVVQYSLNAALPLSVRQGSPIWDVYRQVQALAALVPHLSREQQIQAIQRGIDDALALEGEWLWLRFWALAMLVPYLSGEQQMQALQRGLDTALAIVDDADRASALAMLVPYLSGEQQMQALQHSLDAALTVADRFHCAMVLANLAPHLTGALLQRGLDEALTIKDNWLQREVLAGLELHLTEEQRFQLRHYRLDSALALKDDGPRSMPPMFVQQWREIEHQRELDADLTLNKRRRKQALVVLEPDLIGEQQSESLQRRLDAAVRLESRWEREWALSLLVPILNGEQQSEVLQHRLDAALTLEREWERLEALAVLALYSIGEQQTQALYHGLDVALALNGLERARALGMFAPLLSGMILQRSLDAALTSDEEWSRVVALAALAPQLNGELFQRGLDAALDLKREDYRARALAAFLPFVQDQDSLLKSIRQVLVNHLLAIKYQDRLAILAFCASEHLFTPPILSPTTLGAIAAHIIEICQEWHWL